MRFRTSLFLITLFVPCFTTAAWSTPLPPHLRQVPGNPRPMTNCCRGKSHLLGDAELSVRVTKDQDVNTVQFLADDKTKVEGKFDAGAQATVEYRSNADKNIAVHVIVTPSSGMSWY